MTIAIIGGTGLYALGTGKPEIVPTPYGDATLLLLQLAGRDVAFLARHGRDHALPPHRVNYRANIWALHALGVREVVATQSVGSMNKEMAPGDFVVLSQFIDWTKGRASTFFDGETGPVLHVDVTQPYCPEVAARLLQAGEFLEDRVHGAGVYACTEGPRFETAAEIRALRLLGADVVGMTNVPEAVLAREAGLCYAAICIVCNWGAGMTEFPLTHQEVLDTMTEQTANLQQLLLNYLSLSHEGTCRCEELGFAQYLPSGNARAGWSL